MRLYKQPNEIISMFIWANKPFLVYGKHFFSQETAFINIK